MSNSQYETYGTRGMYGAHGMYGPYGTYIPGPGTGRDAGPGPGRGMGPGPSPSPVATPVPAPAPASAPTQAPAQAAGYGVWEAPVTDAAYRDTYRPAYEQQGLPRQKTGEVVPGMCDPFLPSRSDRRAARRRRARNARRSESAMRRLVPQALVVAFLAGGTTAFVAKDKAIELSVDGKSRTLHTFADDVTELLAEEGVPVGAHDRVTPARGAELSNGDQVEVDYGRPVRLTLDGRRSEVWTTADTVEGALGQFGVRAEGAYLSAPRSRTIGRAGLDLDVRTERAITVMVDGRVRTVRTNAGSVREVVREAGITLSGQDTTSVPLDSFPRDGQTVTVLRVTGGKEVREELIPFQVRRTQDPSLFRGIEVIDSAGQPGVRRVTYLMRTVNGVRQKPRRERAEVLREPRTQFVRVGIKPPPVSVAGTDGLNWSALADCESGGRPAAVDPSGTYGGLYQFDTPTWHSLGGKGHPQDASSAEQTYRAKKLYLRHGSSPWPHCGPRLHG